MRPVASAVLGLVLGLPAFLPGAASAGDPQRVLKIVNHTRSLLLELYTSPVDVQAWGADQLGNMRIAAGGNVTVNLHSGEGACLFDLMMVFSDGEKVVRRENVCDSGTLIVTDHEDDPLPAI
jgi:hypothetical protein